MKSFLFAMILALVPLAWSQESSPSQHCCRGEQGMGRHGMKGDTGHASDMALFHFLLDNSGFLANGYEEMRKNHPLPKR